MTSTTDLMTASADELAATAFAAYFTDLTRADLDEFIHAFDDSLNDALDRDIDDLLKNRNECDLFPDAIAFDFDDDRFFDRIYRTDLYSDFIDALELIIINKFAT